jgi:two-component system, OmpR family, response regulator
VRGGRILVVEDDDTLRRAIVAMLSREGFDVHEFSHGHELPAIIACAADVALLDVMLPGCDGFTIARHLHSAGTTKVLFLTARDGLDDRLAGFEIGADDYVVKPVALPELLARIRVILRRVSAGENERLEFDRLVIDLDAAAVTFAGEPIELTLTEFKLLAHFARHAGRVLSKLQLLTHVWGYDDYDPNLVEVHVSALRRKLEPVAPNCIATVRGVGYRFDRQPVVKVPL